MEFVLLGWPADGPTLRLDYRRFAYAGKFVMSNTGKAVAVEDERWRAEGDGAGNDGNEPYDDVIAAVAFNADRTDPGTAWLRYVTVRGDRKGEGIGPRLCAFAVGQLSERFERARIAVNNPFAYEALYKVGFGFTGGETGVAELVLAYPPEDPDGSGGRAERYAAGLERFRDRELSDGERAFLDARTGPPEAVYEPSRASGEKT
jgi:hypothetical protein